MGPIPPYEGRAGILTYSCYLQPQHIMGWHLLYTTDRLTRLLLGRAVIEYRAHYIAPYYMPHHGVGPAQ